MKYTLLELTQDVLSSMDSDEINSIHDSPESQQVVTVIKTVYDDIISRGGLNSNKISFNLAPSGDPLFPVTMTKPDNVDLINWLKYDTAGIDDTGPVWTDMRYLPFIDYIDYMHQFDQSETNVETFVYNEDGFITTFAYKTDTPPMYYTTTNDNTIIFDAIDLEVEATLQGSKTLGYGSKKTDFTATDSFVPNLQPQQFALLLNEAKSLAWAELKQMPHEKAEQSARRNWRHLQKTRQSVPDGTVFDSGAHSFDKLPNYARRRRGW